jgi:hypothetical protein
VTQGRARKDERRTEGRRNVNICLRTWENFKKMDLTLALFLTVVTGSGEES